jgi:hypothetical protein
MKTRPHTARIDHSVTAPPPLRCRLLKLFSYIIVGLALPLAHNLFSRHFHPVLLVLHFCLLSG